MEDANARTIRHESEHGRWELVRGTPAPALRGAILGYQGYIEDRTTFTTRLEAPHPNIVLIVNLGPAIRISGAGHPTAGLEIGSFVAGLHDHHVFVAATGPMRCLQVDLTPLGAAQLLRVPMHELVNRTVALSDLIGFDAGRLAERLDAARDWPARFALMDAALTHRFVSRTPLAREVVWAWHHLLQSGGRVPIATLASEVGWSRKHLAQRFRDQVGLPPKAIARVIRFDRAVRRLEEHPDSDRADIALALGYYDQPHFNREFRAFTGLTPGEYLNRAIHEGGIVGD